MPLKLETLKAFEGFGEGETRDKGGNPLEYYFSRNMRYKRGGIEPGWRIVESKRSSTVTCDCIMDLIQAFDERKEGTDTYVYAVDDEGDIFKVQDLLITWAYAHNPGTASSGNGLIVDHSSSQMVLYPQIKYLGGYDGVVWKDTWKDFGKSQDIKRPSDIYEDWVVIGNGSSVALLNVTDDSWNNQAFTLPDKFVTNGGIKSGKNGVLIGANFNNRGVAILWDCQADRAIAPWIWFEQKIQGIAKWNGIWVVSTGRKYHITDGYSILKTYNPPDLTDAKHNFGPPIPTGIVGDGDNILIGGNGDTYNRRRRGVYILNLLNGLWEFCPTSTGTEYNTTTMGGIFISSSHTTYVGYGDGSLTPPQEYVGRLYENYDSHSDAYFISQVAGGQTDYKKKAEGIILNMGYVLQNYTIYDNPAWTIKVKLYDFSRQLWGHGLAKEDSVNKNEIYLDVTTGVVGGYNQIEIGDEITVLEGLNAGEIRQVTAMRVEGDASTTVVTLDSDLSELTLQNEDINISPFKLVGTKTLSQEEILDGRLYIPVQKSIIGRKFLIKVVVSATYQRPHFSNLGFLYDELTLQ